MTELEKMERARDYIRMLAEGSDPISEQELPGDSALNQVRLSRCFFYVAEVLDRVIANGGEVSRRVSGSSKVPFSATPEQLAAVPITDELLNISRLCEVIQESVGGEAAGKLGRTLIPDWLTGQGYLRTEIVQGKRRRRLSDKGAAVGITEEKRSGQNGEYLAILYGREAQQFVLDNLLQILADKEQPDGV
ncbi:MAG: hypothetical protein ACK5LX_10995 [Oscillospiraceae bacterium]